MMSGFSRVTWAMNLAKESSETSHSRWKVNRVKISWISKVSQVGSKPTAVTVPSRKSRIWSYSEVAMVSGILFIFVFSPTPAGGPAAWADPWPMVARDV